MNNIYQLVYYEGDEKHVVWSIDRDYAEKKIKSWEKQGFAVGDDNITQISFTDEEELVAQLNDLED